MASFNKIMSMDEWRKIMAFNDKVMAETGTPIIDINALGVMRRGYFERLEMEAKAKAEVEAEVKELLAVTDKANEDEYVLSRFPAITN